MAAPKRRSGKAIKGDGARLNGAAIAALPVQRTMEQSPPAGGLAVTWRQLEVWAWIALAAIALGLRLLNVDGSPLQPSEGTLAMDSWRILQREGIQIGAAPLLIYLNAVLFLMLGATDAVARGLPALVGTAVALSPILLRHRLGRIGALAAALCLVTSPTLIFASRTVDPTILSVGLGLGLALMAERWSRSHRPGYLYAGAALAALLLMSGPLAFYLVIILVGFMIILRQYSGAARMWKIISANLPHSSSSRLHLLATFVLTFAIVGTGLATNLDGLGVSVAGPLAAWAAGLSGFGGQGIWLFPALLVGYEPCALILGIAGAVLALRRERWFEIFLVWWAVVGFVLLALSDGRDPVSCALIVVPLGLLAGVALDPLPARLAERTELQRFGIFAAVALSLVATVMIATGYVTLPDPIVPSELALAPPLLLIAFVAGYAFNYGWPSAFRASAAVAAFCLFVFNVHAATLLNPGGQLNPAELYTGTATSVDVRPLATDVSTILDELQIAQQLQGRNVNQTVEIAAPFADPLAWYLKGEPDVQIVDQVTDAPGIAVLAANSKAPRGSYAGELYQFSVSAPRPALTPVGLWRWWIYREATPRTQTYVKVYVKTQLAPP